MLVIKIILYKRIKRLKHKSTTCCFIHLVFGWCWHQEWKTTVSCIVLTWIHLVNKVMVILNVMKNALTPTCLAGENCVAGRGRVLLHCIGE